MHHDTLCNEDQSKQGWMPPRITDMPPLTELTLQTVAIPDLNPFFSYVPRGDGTNA